MGKTLPKEFRLSILERDNFCCVFCGKGGQTSQWILEVDHILPRSQGGGDEQSNLRTLCVRCHDIRHHGYYSGRLEKFPSRLKKRGD